MFNRKSIYALNKKDPNAIVYTDADGNWGPALICGEKEHDGKRYIVCTLDIREENPVAQRFLRNLMSEL